MVSTSRGVDRVPKRLQRLRRSVKVVHDSSKVVIRRHLTKRGIVSTEVRESYVNPARDGKGLRSGRLRKELQ